MLLGSLKSSMVLCSIPWEGCDHFFYSIRFMVISPEVEHSLSSGASIGLWRLNSIQIVNTDLQFLVPKISSNFLAIKSANLFRVTFGPTSCLQSFSLVILQARSFFRGGTESFFYPNIKVPINYSI